MPQERPAGRVVGYGGGVERVAVDRVEFADELRGDLRGRDDGDRHLWGTGWWNAPT